MLYLVLYMEELWMALVLLFEPDGHSPASEIAVETAHKNFLDCGLT